MSEHHASADASASQVEAEQKLQDMNVAGLRASLWLAWKHLSKSDIESADPAELLQLASILRSDAEVASRMAAYVGDQHNVLQSMSKAESQGR